MIRIVPYTEEHAGSISEMMLEIAAEYPQSLSDPAYRPAPPDCYWIALQDNELVGTVALTLAEDHAVLRKMMLRKKFRGELQGVSDLLLRTAIEHCLDLKLRTLYLGTMDQLKAAQRFYEKKGFARIGKEELPAGFRQNPVDDVFYRIGLI